MHWRDHAAQLHQLDLQSNCYITWGYVACALDPGAKPTAGIGSRTQHSNWPSRTRIEFHSRTWVSRVRRVGNFTLAAVTEGQQRSSVLPSRDDRVSKRETILRCHQPVVFARYVTDAVARTNDRPVDGWHADIVVAPELASRHVKLVLVQSGLHDTVTTTPHLLLSTSQVMSFTTPFFTCRLCWQRLFEQVKMSQLSIIKAPAHHMSSRGRYVCLHLKCSVCKWQVVFRATRTVKVRSMQHAHCLCSILRQFMKACSLMTHPVHHPTVGLRHSQVRKLQCCVGVGLRVQTIWKAFIT